MSVQIALLAPATRVASRKLGPSAGSRGPSSRRAAPAACAASRFASTCGRCETQAIRRSWGPASIAVGRAPRLTSSGAAARRARRRSPRAGVRYQVAPSNRSARACSTPAVSAPGQRMAADEPLVGPGGRQQALGRADVADHAVRRRSAAAPPPTVGQRAPTGAAANTASAPRDGRGDVSAALVDRAQLERPGAARARRGHSRMTSAPGTLAGRQPDRAADQPNPEDGNGLHGPLARGVWALARRSIRHRFSVPQTL